ncbi:MAG TPA: hypothetical protein VM536_07990, partial [Chloroflexia bacterium]|nr:hypothetical protein [Chloroflexia bacterium]
MPRLHRTALLVAAIMLLITGLRLAPPAARAALRPPQGARNVAPVPRAWQPDLAATPTNTGTPPSSTPSPTFCAGCPTPTPTNTVPPAPTRTPCPTCPTPTRTGTPPTSTLVPSATPIRTATPTMTGTPPTATPTVIGCWSLIASPSGGSLWGVSARATDDVWAVGTYIDTSYHTLIEHWDGGSWQVVASPNPGLGGVLYGVDARTATDAWAVGNYYAGSNTYVPLILHWDGAQWSIVPNPAPGSTTEGLRSVLALAADDAWAVGSTAGSSLIEHWDGTQWNIVPGPVAALYSIAGLAANDL